jgi:protocatechuate 3,4-dioxygenase, beta subunit
VFGRVRDVEGRAVPGARVEIWQCNAFGRYHHAGDSRNVPLDPGFQGYGETVSTADGAYRFRTIRPIAYPGRTPHIHFAITVPQGGKLVTQMYVEGEAGNERDGVLRNIRDPEARKSVIVPLKAAPELDAGALAGQFDIVLGLNATRT